MRTFKKSAVSHDNPEYLIRNKFILLQKDGNRYFSSANRQQYKLPQVKPIKTIKKEHHFGYSKDSPFISRYTYINAMTSSIFDEEPQSNIRQSLPDKKLSHIFLRECVQKAKADTNKLIRYMRSETPSVIRAKKNTFTLLMTTSKETKVRESLLNRYNVDNLNSSVIGCDSPYAPQLLSYTSQLKKANTMCWTPSMMVTCLLWRPMPSINTISFIKHK